MRVVDVPAPEITPTQVLVRTLVSAISPGTEGAVTALAQSSLLAKAKARPDLVRQVVKRARTEGLGSTIRAVRSRLAEDLPLGYSAAGIALDVGEAVDGIAPGTLVATGGAGHANHAEFQAVPGLLCVPVPDGISPHDAALATIGSIAMHGLRLADVGPGASVAVVGLGLVGQLTLRLARAAGYRTAGVDVTTFPVERARADGHAAFVEAGEDTTVSIVDWTRGRGVDAVLVTAGGATSDAIMRTPVLCRDRATIVVVGDVGLELGRTPFYEKELTIRFARSYGPGRYERSYEQWGVDYPPGFVRWTEGRNVEAFLDLIRAGSLRVSDLVTHRFPIERAEEAYALVETRSEPFIGIELTYGEQAQPTRSVQLRPSESDAPGVGFIGAGGFAKTVLLPAFRQAGPLRFVSVASASGLSARRLAEDASFERAASGAGAIVDDPDVEIVVIATPHDVHASQVVAALRAGKHVFCEKPVALTEQDLDEVEEAWRASGTVLFVGFNRRWSRAMDLVHRTLAGGSGPLVMTYRVASNKLPDDHWYSDRRQGGRLLGEVCHFIDACNAIVGTDPIDAYAAGSGARERLLSENLVVTLAYPDGSLAAITYSPEADPSTGKERLEILGRGKTLLVEDFRSVAVGGTVTKTGGKGHAEEVRAFVEAVRGRTEAPTEALLGSHRAALRAVAALLGSGREP